MMHDSELVYNFSSVKFIKKIGVGTSNPDLYSNCSLDLITSYDQCNRCESYIVKLGIGKNHEFIDSPLAAWFLNYKKLHFSATYPKDGYLVENYNPISLKILGSASPLICNFESIYDIFKNSTNGRYFDVNINILSDNDKRSYIDNLKSHLNKTNPESIADYFIGQYLSGGGDPNPGNIGFAKICNDSCQYSYVITKVDLGASFKSYSKTVTGNSPNLKFNKYAFEIPNEYCGAKLYNFAIKNGNILMPGAEYDGSIMERTSLQQNWRSLKKTLSHGIDSATFSGQGNTGFYNGYYNKNADVHGIDMSEYVNENHLTNAIKKVCDFTKEELSNILQVMSTNILDLFSSTQQINDLPIIKDGQEEFDRYINEDIIGLIGLRYDCICQDANNICRYE